MLDDAADEIEAALRKISILITGEGWLAVFPDREVHVHARAVITENWLWHEGCGFAISVSHVVDHILINLHVVSTHGEGLIARSQFMLG